MGQYILAIDQGTTSTRAIAFDLGFAPQASAQIELTQHFPEPGWVEHDPEEIWSATVAVCREVIAKVGGAERIAAIGITNQRETTIVWDAATGKPAHRAIVWQDRRTADACERLRAEGQEPRVQAATGLVLDPYFSATKLRWILDRVATPAESLRFGTVDCFLLSRLTGGLVHATDVTNASRTLLLNLATRAWDDELLRLLGVPRTVLPRVQSCAGLFGVTDPALFGRAIPITGIAGDQQAALVGHGCLSPGMAKATYGTGCFLVMNMGVSPPRSQNRLLATVGYQVDGALAYALEGSIFSAGATIQWLRDGMRLIRTSAESEAIAASLPDNGGVYLVPAFAGLGAPQWSADARGAIVGLTRDSRAEHVVRAGLEAVAYQTADLLDALRADGAPPVSSLLVDGGLAANGWAMQYLADICDVEVMLPAFQEVTALGAAKLAALGAGVIPNLSATPAIASRWRPGMAAERRDQLRQGWQRAVAGALEVTAAIGK
ncbi:MAG: glycerol kinase GlpK [Hyphomonadaceae bacterium]|nr:glycerol kinase GlpK [Hyphomonadaceae bacterium]